jgi:NAD(P)-dependent dehydrogenase (short-subunit alcohol dehydrogenase family)
MTVDGRVAVVTGGSDGIGFGIARALARAGASVAIWARRPERSADAVAELRGEGLVADAFGCDAGHEADVDAAAAATVARFGRIDICVANAGGGGRHHVLMEFPLEDWEQVVGVNLTGAFLCFRACVRDMATRDDGGALVAVSSAAAVHASPGLSAYAAAKAGLGGLVRSLAAELAPLGIRANILQPGWTENSTMSVDRVSESLAVETLASIPAGRWGTPDDLGTAALYLADPTLRYHTGAVLAVDGGYSVMAPYLAVRQASSVPGTLERRGHG